MFLFPGRSWVGLSNPQAVIAAGQISYRADGAAVWVPLTAAAEIAISEAAATGRGAGGHSFDFALDVPEDAALQEYSGTVVFDVTTVMVGIAAAGCAPEGGTVFWRRQSSRG